MRVWPETTDLPTVTCPSADAWGEGVPATGEVYARTCVECKVFLTMLSEAESLDRCGFWGCARAERLSSAARGTRSGEASPDRSAATKEAPHLPRTSALRFNSSEQFSHAMVKAAIRGHD